MIFLNCASRDNRTRLEKWSDQVRAEEPIFGKPASEVIALKPNQIRKDNALVVDEYLTVEFESGDFAEQLCKSISETETKDSKLWIEKLEQYIFSNNVNLQILDRSFDYTPAEFGKYTCVNLPVEKKFIIDDIRNCLSSLKKILDDPNKSNRKARLEAILNRISVPAEKGKSELDLKKEAVERTEKEFSDAVFKEIRGEYLIFRIVGWTAYFAGLSLDSFTASKGILYGIFIYTTFPYISNGKGKFGDFETIRLARERRDETFKKIILEAEGLLKDSHYLLLNHHKNTPPGFDDFEIHLDFQITNYQDLHKFHYRKYIDFQSATIHNICFQYDCNNQGNLELLKKNGKIAIEELKRRKNSRQF